MEEERFLECKGSWKNVGLTQSNSLAFELECDLETFRLIATIIPFLFVLYFFIIRGQLIYLFRLSVAWELKVAFNH